MNSISDLKFENSNLRNSPILRPLALSRFGGWLALGFERSDELFASSTSGKPFA
jgi:hypothetical protein